MWGGDHTRFIRREVCVSPWARSLCTLMETQQCLHLMDAICNRTVFKLYMELSLVVHLQEREEDPVISYDSKLIRVYQVDIVADHE